MNTFLHKQLFMIILIAAASLCIIVGTWGVALFDSETPPDTTPIGTIGTTTTPQETTTATTTSTTETTTETTTAPIETTTGSNFVEPTGKYIALTFDDGPSSAYTAEILDILERYNAKATFFVNGYQISTSKAAVMRRAVALGCEIGNHTENHKNLTKLSATELYKEIMDTTEKIEAVCGTEVTLLRPPGGNTNLSVMQKMYDAGLRMHTIMWNNDSRDWAFDSEVQSGALSTEEAIRLTLEEIDKWPYDGAILLMHDIKSITPEVLERVLQKLSTEGYSFVTVSEMFDFEGMGEDAYFSKFYAANYIVNMK